MWDKQVALEVEDSVLGLLTFQDGFETATYSIECN
jgi:hypothetical protein